MGLPVHGVKVYVYNEADGDPRVDDHGLHWWAVQKKDALKGEFESDATFGNSYLQFIEDFGLTMRAFVVYSNTRKSDWIFSDSTNIEEWRLESGDYVYRLFSRSSLGTAFTGTSNYDHPPNPNFAFTLASALPPNDWSYVIRPYFIFSFGSGAYGIVITDNKCHLYERQPDNSIKKVLDIGKLEYKTALGESDEGEVIIRCQDGAILISVNSGEEYKIYRKKDGTPIEVPQGSFGIDTRGAQILFGVHQIDFVDSYWDSPKKNSGFARVLAVPSFDDLSDSPFGSSISYTDTSDLSSNTASFRASFAKSSAVGSVPFTFKYAPTLRGTLFSYPVITTPPDLVKDDIWAGRIYKVSWQKPLELSGGNATIYARFPDQSFLQGLRFRKCEIEITTNMTGTPEDPVIVFTGYVSKIGIKFGIGYIDATINLVNAAGLFQRMTWTPFDIRPLDTLTRNDAADWVLYTDGWGVFQRVWDVLGNVTIPRGSIDNPTMMIKDGESKFSTMRQIFDPIQLELACTDDGLFRTVRKGSHTGVLHTPVHAKSYQSDRRKIMKAFDVELDYTNSATMVSVTGKDIYDNDIFAYLIDEPAETNLLSGRYQHHRNVIHEQMPDAITIYDAINRAQAISRETLLLKREATIPLELDVLVGRNDEIQVYGVGITNIPDGSFMEVKTVSGNVEVDINNGRYSAQSVIGARLLS